MISKFIEVKGITDGRGMLISLEALKNVPFEIKRVYCLTDLKADHPRGFHAHRNLIQLIICLSGSCDFILNDGKTVEKVNLNSPSKGLIVESMVWREMHNFSKDCVIMVLASEYYDESDYIRDYEIFKKEAQQ
jgi:dTDP-4-dehydrorhamnose 3,5-epimerase-like enzyme